MWRDCDVLGTEELLIKTDLARANVPGDGLGPAGAIAILLVVAAALSAPALLVGRFVFDSGALNTNWAEGFYGEIRAGNIYPRWLPQMNDGMGSPVFYFYGPLPFYLSALSIWISGNPALSVVVSSSIMLALSGLAVYPLLRSYSGRAASVIAASAYMASPYHYHIDYWLRSAYGEQAAFIFMPLALLCIRRLHSGIAFAGFLALICAGMALSHIPTTILFAPVLAAFSLLEAYSRKSLKVLAFAGIGGSLGVMISAIYLAPAWVGREFIKSEVWADFVPAQQLLFSSYDRPWYPLMEFVLIADVVIAALGIASIWCFRPSRFAGLAVWVATAAVLVFLTTALAYPFWMHAPWYNIIQFPWRLLAALELASAVLLAASLQAKPRLVILLFVPFALSFFAFATLTIGQIIGSSPELEKNARAASAAYEISVTLRADAPEYLPACADISEEWPVGKVGTSTLLRRYRDVTTPDSSLRIFYYPFLDVYHEGRLLTSDCDPKTGFIQVMGLPREISGISVRRKHLAIEVYSMICSLAGFLVVFGLLVWSLFSRSRSRDPISTPNLVKSGVDVRESSS